MGLHDDRLLRQLPLPSDLHVAKLQHVDDWRLVRLVLVVQACLFREERPELLDIDDWDNLAMLVEVDAVMVLASSITAATWMLAVLANTASAIRDLTAEVAALLIAGGHACKFLNSD